jgi:predicted nucleic acid-binding protein
MKDLVVDASVAIKWFADEDHSLVARRLLKVSVRLHGPELLLAECGNILWKWVRRKELSPKEAEDALGVLIQIPILLHKHGALSLPALQIATRLDATQYDSLYMALAVKLNCPLVTADRKLFDKAKKSPLKDFVTWIEDAPT